MDPFLKPQREWRDVVPSLCPRDEYHPEENEAIEQLVHALKNMNRVFGPYQAKAMVETELDWSVASGSFHPVVCHDGTKISAQTRDGTMCKRNAKQRVYTHVEVFIHGATDPFCQSASELVALISKHGGIKYGHLPALDFGRDPALGDRCNDDDAVDYAMRMGRKRKCIPYYKPFRFPPLCNWTYEEFSDSDQSQSSVIAPVTKYRVRAADPGALTAEEQSDRGQRLLASGEQVQPLELAPRRPDDDLDARLENVLALLQPDLRVAAAEELPEHIPEVVADHLERLLEAVAALAVHLPEDVHQAFA